MKLNKNRVVLGMSGGVDSSAVAKILKDRGYEVIGVSLRLHQQHDNVADFEESFDYTEFEDAKKVCDGLEIQFKVFHLKDIFRNTVQDYMANTYLKGETPNPCVQCNKHIKFGAFFKIADMLGAYYLATGHYCSVVKDKDDYYKVKKASSIAKDQSYMMFYLGQNQLQRLLMPLGEFESKDSIRDIVKDLNLDLENKKDSQEICFVPNDDYISYLETDYNVSAKVGNFVDLSGNIIGKHKGIIHYTIGQRKGLGMSFGKPMYVINIDSNKNEVILGDNNDLFENKFIIKESHFAYSKTPELEKDLTCKIRYSSKVVSCYLTKESALDDNSYIVHVKEKQRAITTGQACVIYQGDYVFGGGIISKY